MNEKKWVVFNPHNKPENELPYIFVFSNVIGGGEGPAHALAEDGEGLGSHWCSHEGFALWDLGVLEGYSADRHETYQSHYPDGYRMKFVPSAQVESDPGLLQAFELNKQKASHDNAAQN